MSVVVAVVLSLSSCADSDKDEQSISEEAVITKFALMGNDTIEGYSFVVDSDSMVIYNPDSIEYGLGVDSLYAVINPTFYKVWVNDTVDFYLFDTLWMNFEQSVWYTVVAADEKTEATYELRINRHTVDPDTMVWNGVASQVYRGVSTAERAVAMGDRLVYMVEVDGAVSVYVSSDGRVWDESVPEGLPAGADLRHAVAMDSSVCVTAGGRLYESADGLKWLEREMDVMVDRLLFAMNGVLYAVVTEGESQVLVSRDGGVWSRVAALPYDFPVRGEAVTVAKNPAGVYRAFVVGGMDAAGKCLSSVWSTENGAYWSNLTSGSTGVTPRAYAGVAQYANHLMLFGGRDADGKVVGDELWSKDYGLTWESTAETKVVLPQLYVRRYDLSVVPLQDGSLYLIGGRASDDTSIADVWRGVHYASLPGFVE